jgi:hypothetical protein
LSVYFLEFGFCSFCDAGLLQPASVSNASVAKMHNFDRCHAGEPANLMINFPSV